MYETNYNNGLRHGYNYTWYYDGRLAYKEKFVNDEIQNKVISHLKNSV
jgi:antitoxin component YwqK of YwqJK toxin-antitoxin module